MVLLLNFDLFEFSAAILEKGLLHFIIKNGKWGTVELLATYLWL